MSGLAFAWPSVLWLLLLVPVAGWLAFAVLLFGRARYGWRGRTALRWVVGGTILLVLGYLGSKFVSEILLNR